MRYGIKYIGVSYHTTLQTLRDDLGYKLECSPNFTPTRTMPFSRPTPS
jgi:hypothetical protein